MRLILARHGNTFEPGSVPYCIGATEDLPLVEKGRMQAERFGQALKDAGINPVAWYRGPLIRHKQFTEISLGILETKETSIVDPRLNELDYGSWAGLTDQQIKGKFGAQLHEDWALRSVWPVNADWEPSFEALQTDISSFLGDLAIRYRSIDTVVAVTSGGRLRYFLRAVPGEFERRSQSGDVKISTGHVCIFNYASGAWALSRWNAEPTAESLQQELTSFIIWSKIQ